MSSIQSAIVFVEQTLVCFLFSNKGIKNKIISLSSLTIYLLPFNLKRGDNVKYAILVGDGMSDYPITDLDNKTPLEIAKIPNIDEIAESGMVGVVKTVPSIRGHHA